MSDEGGVNAAELAQSAAAAAVSGADLVEGELLEASYPPQDHEVTEEPSYFEGIEEDALREAVEERDAEAAAQVPAPVVEEEPTVDEIQLQLMELGIDLGVTRADLPEDLWPSYEQLASQAVMAANVVRDQMNHLQTQQIELQQFAQKLNEDPSKILLTMAVNQPEAFQKAINTYEEMQHDERMRDLVVRELQAEARLAAAERQAQVFQARQTQARVKQVERATEAAAKRHGVTYDLAEKFVAMQIQAGGVGDIDIAQIDGIVAQLKPAVRAPVAASPAKRQAVAQAPTQAVAGTGAPSGNVSGLNDEASPGLTRASRNPLMDIVKAASARVSRGEAE